MANIPLREYILEIEDLIERGQTEEAIAHCRHILKFFPKHIETYRLLGKAFLESKRYADAADIFQRVLSSVPDDFVAHIGMSIIREDEGNLDASIWHMERAFEVQPSNVAIQDELRTLYGKRDGVEPSKIRLTRGALARMYALGNLYSQAIGELRAALAVEPKRMDLQVLLARMYHLDKQQVNAAKTASQLLNKLPYCYEANLILGEILSETGREEEAKTYLERATELDPYQAYISDQHPTTESVPANAVRLEKLDWDAAKSGITSQPMWATSLGVEMPEQAETDDSLPEWLVPSSEAGGEATPLETVSALTSPFTDSELGLKKAADLEFENLSTEETDMDEDNIPDWMKESGWGPKDPNTPDEPPANLDADTDDENISEERLEKAEIPEWLQAIAPKDLETGEEPAEAEPTHPSELPDWILQGTGELDSSQATGLPQSAEDSPVPDWLEEIVSETSSQGEADIPSPEWLQETAGDDLDSVLETPEAAEELAPTDSMDVPDWLKELSEEETLIPTALADEDVPDWLKDFGESQAKAPMETSEEETAPTAGLAEEALEEKGKDKAPTDDWLPEEIAPSTTEEEVPDWLEGLSENKETSSEEAVSPALMDASAEPGEAESGAEVPEWLQGLEDEFPSAQALSEVGMEETDSTPVAEEETPAPEAIEMLDLESEDAAMAWLESLAAKHGVAEEELLTQPEERTDTAPEWLQEIAEDPPAATEMEASPKTPAEKEPEPAFHPEEQQPQPEVIEDTPENLEDAVVSIKSGLAEEAEIESPISAELIGDEMDEDAAMAWLEGLAAKHGVAEEELLTQPEERSETTPEWLQEIIEETPPEAEVAETAIQDEIAQTVEAEAPATLEEAEPEVEQPQPAAETSPAEAAESPDEALPAELAAILEAEAEPSEEALPPELQQALPAETEHPEEASPLTEESVPEWLTESAEQFIAQASAEEVQKAISALTEKPTAPPTQTKPEPESAPAPEVEPTEAPPETVAESNAVLEQARELLAKGEVDTAIKRYTQLIQREAALDAVITDLEEALKFRYPVSILVWQTLGDAYVRSNRLQDALDAYTKAEELLR